MILHIQFENKTFASFIRNAPARDIDRFKSAMVKPPKNMKSFTGTLSTGTMTLKLHHQLLLNFIHATSKVSLRRLVSSIIAPDESIIKEVVRKDPYQISLFPVQSEEIQMIAALSDPESIILIKNMHTSVKLAAVRRHPYSIKHMTSTNKEVRKVAIGENFRVIQYVDKPSKEEQLLCIDGYMKSHGLYDVEQFNKLMKQKITDPHALNILAFHNL